MCPFITVGGNHSIENTEEFWRFRKSVICGYADEMAQKKCK